MTQPYIILEYLINSVGERKGEEEQGEKDENHKGKIFDGNKRITRKLSEKRIDDEHLSTKNSKVVINKAILSRCPHPEGERSGSQCSTV